MSISRVIVALDFSKKEDALRVVDDLDGLIDFFKVGYELFISEGSEIIKLLKMKNKKVFFDLKLHDIPNTIYKATKAIINYQVDMLTLHTMGGIEMMKKAVEVVKDFSEKEAVKTKIIGVTVLTSLDENNLKEIFNTSIDTDSLVCHLALKAKEAGLDGVVASAWEIKKIKKLCGKNFLVITPGIRIKKEKDDQKRVTLPLDAISYGADYIVIGRAITLSENPRQTLLEIFK